MTNLEIGVLGIFTTLGLIAIRVPIGIALGLVSIAGISLITNSRVAWGVISATPFDFVGDWSLSAAPMFLLMGYIATATGLTNGLFNAMRIMLARLPGGLAVASVGACALFASASGSSVATSAAMSRIAVPEMLRYNYDKGLATGVIAASGTLGSLIPPSVLLVLYGVYAQVSVGQLFMAGVIPGILSALIYMAMIMTRVKLNPALAGNFDQRFTRAEKIAALKDIWPLPLLIASVIGGMFIDSIGLLLLTLPLPLPLVNSAGMDLLWFGIIAIKLLEIGLVTPPVGLNVYVIKGALGDKVSLARIFAGVGWFVGMDAITLVLLIAFPMLVLWLPGIMFG